MNDALSTIRAKVDLVPWDCLAHAYDFALDAPQQLDRFFTAFEGGGNVALAEAVEWMWSSVLHQGSVYSASVPAIDILVALFDIEPDHPAGMEILSFVDVIAESFRFNSVSQEPSSALPESAGTDPLYESWVGPGVSSIEEDRDRYFVAAHLRREILLKLLERALPVVAGVLSRETVAMRSAALGVLCRVAGEVPELADDESLTGLPSFIGDDRFSAGSWISVAMSSRSVPSELLSHADRRVRLAAAMSSAAAEDSRAREELVQAVNEVEFLEASFPNGAPTLQGHLRFGVLQTLLQRVEAESADPVVIAAICNQLKGRATKFSVDDEWGPVVQWVFAERWTKLPIDDADLAPLPTELTVAQASVLETLVGLDELWDARFGNGSLAFRRVQLPYDQKVLKRLVARAGRGPRWWSRR